MKAFRKPWLWWCLGIGLGVLLVASFIWAAIRFVWFPSKTPWDWLQLLVIPFALALIALGFNLLNARTERRIAQERYKQDQEIAKQHYEQDQQLALDKQQEDLLQAYLDRMSELLLEKGLLTSKPENEVRNVARTRTISVLKQLDGGRVKDVFTFLREAGLSRTTSPIVNLKDADFSSIEWVEADLRGANLRGVNLNNYNLSRTILVSVDLSQASLFETNFSHANLRGTNLSGSTLWGAGFVEANLSGACLREADLHGADLSRAIFSESDFIGGLSEADLKGAILSGAKIDKSKLTQEQIAQAVWD